ncbi:MAG: DUF3501 family protein [Acidimicrobiales bacterium]|nr:DUF3501 family protein [Acidimicrobiales bacterium]
MEKLTLKDIKDLRDYERSREEFRDKIITLKKIRRISIGPLVTLLFENRETMLFQIQEMARAEKIMSDDGIQEELDAYNPLIPGAGELSATLFIELTSKDELIEWLPKLVGIERSLELLIGTSQISAPSIPEQLHEQMLTRDDVTASVHYIHFEIPKPAQAEFLNGPVILRCNLETYRHELELSKEVLAELSADMA